MISREQVCQMWGVKDEDLDAFVEKHVIPGTNMAILPPVMLTPRPGKYILPSFKEGVEDQVVEITFPQRWIRL